MVKRSMAENEQFYRQLVTEQEKSGLSINAFAATRGIPRGTLSSWRHELKQRDAARARTVDKATKSPFVQVKVVGGRGASVASAPEPASRARPESGRTVVYEVVLGEGRVLRVPADFDEVRVAALVKVVASC